MKKLLTLLLFASCIHTFAQKTDTLSIEKIMRDPKWIGVSPSNIQWSDDSRKVYFNWNPHNNYRDSLYSVTPANSHPQQIAFDEQTTITPNRDSKWNRAHTLKVFAREGDIYLENIKTGNVTQLMHTTDRESNPAFNSDESKILFIRNNNLYALNLHNGELSQLTNFVKSAAKSDDDNNETEQAKWLKQQQLELFDIIKLKDKDARLDKIDEKKFQSKKIKELVTGGRNVGYIQLSPDGRFITYMLTKMPEGEQLTIVPDYVTASGYTEDIPNRTKVGAPQPESETYIFDTQRDTAYRIITQNIPGIKDLPDYVKEYPKELADRTKLNADRKVVVSGPVWNEDGKYAIVIVNALDNKDRWIMKLDVGTGNLTLLDRQHNDAWVSGAPGIGDEWYSTGIIGWLDATHFYYQSEASGYTHIYVADITSGEKKQLTTGKWEVQNLQLSHDKKTFYFNANINHPGDLQFYRLPVSDGVPVKLTSVKGDNDVQLSPDEKWLAIRYSYTNKPWELYIQANKPGAKAIQVTHSTSAEFNAYPWRDAPIITFKNRYGSDVYARLYLPKKADPAKPAVIFVHGAGYLQNVNYAWSYYFRELMFNNMLADEGYTVMDIDYSGSAGYGRDWRTAIYRHMGGKDLTDQVDGVKYLVDNYGINPKHIGIYGGSYGGFMTLMAMFTAPDVFKSGAAIRSVTDWAHYNHGYTADILNEPFNDEKAYRLSSPIYFADGLKGNLLMLHGMVDQNVNFQDIVRLTQKLIELHKENWWLAPYPVEDHAFEQPSSWTDEYKRIHKLFETTLRVKD